MRGRDGVAWYILGDCGSLDPSSNLGPGPPSMATTARTGALGGMGTEFLKATFLDPMPPGYDARTE